MVLILAGAGLVQTYYWRITGLPFMTVRNQYLMPWLIWRFIVAWFFAAGFILLIWDFFAFGLPKQKADSKKRKILAIKT
jgi:hypothetical protein